MYTTHARTILCLLVACLVVSLPTGCGAKKKRATGASVGDLLKKADEEKTPDRKATALLRAARAQVKVGDKTGAADTARKALKALPAKPLPTESEPGLIAPKLVEVAAFLAELGGSDKAQAKAALKSAVDMAGEIGDDVRKAGVYADAGAVYADKVKGVGDSKAAKEALDKAKEIAGGMEDRFKGEALAKVALGYVKGGLTDAAAEMVELLEETGRSLKDARAKAETLAAAANVRVQTGKKDLAKELLDEAAKAAKSIERPESKAYALLAVGQATAAAGDKKTGLALFEEAYKAADKIGDPEQRGIMLNKVGVATDELKKK